MSYYTKIECLDIYNNQGNVHIIYSTIPDKKTCDSSTTIIFDDNFNTPLNDNLYHSLSITHIKFGHRFNHYVYKLPSLVKYVEFGDSFNKTINYLPSTLRSVKLGYKFNKEVCFLPHGLEIIEFGTSFNKGVDNLPRTLKSIKFGLLFNQSIDKLPSSLITLVVGGFFNKSIDNLPISLKELTLGYRFNKVINTNKLPKNISHITLKSNYPHLDKLINDLPVHIKVKVIPAISTNTI